MANDQGPIPLTVLPSDTAYRDSPDAGDPACICSRCVEPIEEDNSAIRVFDENLEIEYRYHPDCFGLHRQEDHDG